MSIGDVREPIFENIPNKNEEISSLKINIDETSERTIEDVNTYLCEDEVSKYEKDGGEVLKRELFRHEGELEFLLKVKKNYKRLFKKAKKHLFCTGKKISGDSKQIKIHKEFDQQYLNLLKLKIDYNKESLSVLEKQKKIVETLVKLDPSKEETMQSMICKLEETISRFSSSIERFKLYLQKETESFSPSKNRSVSSSKGQKTVGYSLKGDTDHLTTQFVKEGSRGGKDLREIQRSAVHFMTISGSGLEGDVFSNSIGSMKNFLMNYRSENRQEEVIARRVAERFKGLQKISKDVEDIEVKRGKIRPEELSWSLVKDVKDLPRGEKMLLPGGTKSHAMLYEIERQMDGYLKFTIINTGKGLSENHQYVRRNGEVKFNPKYEHSGILDSSLNARFFKDLIDIQTQRDHGVQEIYGLLNGKGSLYNERQNEEKFIKTQKLGTCTHKVLSTYLKIQYSEAGRAKGFQKLKVVSKFSTLKDLVLLEQIARVQGLQKSIFGGNSHARENHKRFIDRALETFKQSYAKRKEKLGGDLSLEERRHIDAVIEGIGRNYFLAGEEKIVRREHPVVVPHIPSAPSLKKKKIQGSLSKTEEIREVKEEKVDNLKRKKLNKKFLSERHERRRKKLLFARQCERRRREYLLAQRRRERQKKIDQG